MSFDTYVASGEESAQEQQFLQALASTIQSREASPVPKYATQLYCNFAGRYDTLAVNANMMNATVGVGFPGLSTYKGMFIAFDPWRNLSQSQFIQIGYLGGLTANQSGVFGLGDGNFFTSSPDYIAGTLNWQWPYPSVNISQPLLPLPIFPPATYPNYYDFMAFYRQSFLQSPIYFMVPKWMRSITIGMRLYDNLGVLQPTLIASKANAKWQDISVNEGASPDGRYEIKKIPNNETPDISQYLQYVHGASYGMLAGVSQFVTQNQVGAGGVRIHEISEAQVGGQSRITAQLSNYQGMGFVPPFPYQNVYWQVLYWTSANAYDTSGASIMSNLQVNPVEPNQAAFPNTNCALTFDLPIPPSLPYRYYFRLNQRVAPIVSFTAYSGTYAIEYPSDYPANPPTLIPMGASYDWIRLNISNYAAVTNPVPTGFPTPPVGMPTFNSLALATIPLIGVDITQAL